MLGEFHDADSLLTGSENGRVVLGILCRVKWETETVQ